MYSHTFYGYPVPDCTKSEAEYDRLTCADLRHASSYQLRRERARLMRALCDAEEDGIERRYPVLNAPGAALLRFNVWARDRIVLINGLLGVGAA